MWPEVSVVVTTRNEAEMLDKCICCLLDIDYPKDRYEIIVVDDGSTDNTVDALKKYGEKIRYKTIPWSGGIATRNEGIRMAKSPFVITINSDMYVYKDWLKYIMEDFLNADERLVAVSTFSSTCGNSTTYRRDALFEVGLLDESFGWRNSGYRDDTDLTFRLLDKGYSVKQKREPKFDHIHTAPTLRDKIRYGISRITIHRYDPLLYKKHPKRTKEFLDIKLGFIRNPMRDFQVATGTWAKGTKFSLSSPQGVVLIESKSPLHVIAIVVGGIIYVIAVKLMRLYGSIKYGKLLI